MVSKLIVYPNTPLFEKLRNKTDFSLFPYRNELRGFENEKYEKWEKRFYAEFYLRPSYIFKKIMTFLSSPVESLNNLKSLLRFMSENKKKIREDFF